MFAGGEGLFIFASVHHVMLCNLPSCNLRAAISAWKDCSYSELLLCSHSAQFGTRFFAIVVYLARFMPIPMQMSYVRRLFESAVERVLPPPLHSLQMLMPSTV